MTMINEKLTKEETLLRAMLEREGVTFERIANWKTLADHIRIHRHFLNEELSSDISWDDALFSWYETVYKPLTNALWSINIRRTFPGQGPGDIYLAVSNHWFYLKEKNPDTTPEEAVQSFVETYGTGMARWFSRFFFA